MVTRTSEAVWQGAVQDGQGHLSLGSGTWAGPYTYRSRFDEGEPEKSNPEELLAASHAGCFNMALANRLEQEAEPPEQIHTTAECHLEMDEQTGPTITRIELTAEVEMPNIQPDRFERLASAAKEGCPVSRALGGVEITLDPVLVD